MAVSLHRERSNLGLPPNPDSFNSFGDAPVRVLFVDPDGHPLTTATIVGFHTRMRGAGFTFGGAYLEGHGEKVSGERRISGITHEPETYVHNTLVEFRRGLLPTARAIRIPE